MLNCELKKGVSFSLHRSSFCIYRCFFIANGENDRRPAARRGIHPDPPAVPVDDFLADRQAHARAGVVGAALEFAEEAEQLPPGLRRNADAVIAYGKAPGAFLTLGPQMDLAGRCRGTSRHYP
jgi:hypothetical protein